ncbi:MAG: 50S ribosomal protein L3 N(5)-glutamine methyltransferase [Pseudomonadota bacterium]
MPSSSAEPASGSLGTTISWVAEQLDAAQVFYGHGTDNPWDEAVLLVLTVTGLSVDADRSVLDQGITATELGRVKSLLCRRIEERVPLPYLLGRAWFAGLEFLCDERALVPRSPIAELVLDGFQPWYSGPEPARLLDLCCGGGAIGLAAAHYHPALRVDLADIDAEALDLAKANCRHLSLDARATICESDLFDSLGSARYDIILSNPPYVDARDLSAMPAEYRHEPPQGLGSGEDGLDLTRRILARAGDFLAPQGLLVVEVGNSWEALERAYPSVPFTWLSLQRGGHGVFVMSAQELQSYAASLAS